MAINYVTKDNMGATLDRAIIQGLITTELETPNVNWFNGGKEFTVRSISTSGSKPHTRNKGWNAGTFADAKESFKLTQDRDIEFYVDQQDVDETNQELSMANISKVYFDEHVIPEIDSYRFSKLATIAKTTAQGEAAVKAGYKEEDVDKASVYSALKDGLKQVRQYGSQNVIGYVSSDVMDALERSTEFTRSITNQNIGTTALDSRVTSVDGVILKEVFAADRFYDKFDFADGVKKASDAKPLNFVLVVKPNVIAKVKEQAVYLWAPGQHTEGDGYLYQNRYYHDLFMTAKKVDGLYVSAATAAK